ncbi:MAG: hypothetical protein HZB26_18640 [Candidatus Hydrogenedentes bacterium]|nr:hypothetical protein [Candidatus Hydrogenedentota bacterium]
MLLLMTLLGIEGGARYAWLKAAANEYLVAVLTGDAQLKISPISTAVQSHDIQEFFSRPIPKIRQMEYGWQFADHHRFIVTFENQNTYMFSVGPYGEEKSLSSYYNPKYCIQDVVKWDEEK